MRRNTSAVYIEITLTVTLSNCHPECVYSGFLRENSLIISGSGLARFILNIINEKDTLSDNLVNIY